MNEDEIWTAIDKHRGRLCDMFATLSEEDLRTPSLCDGWTVRDVIAHLTLQQLRLGFVLRELVRHPDVNMNRITHDLACRKAVQPVPDLIAEIRAMIGSRRHNLGVSSSDALIDCLVHGLDVGVPVGRVVPAEPAAAAEAMNRVWERNFPFYARKRLAGVRLEATDVSWSAGPLDGRTVAGPISSILLVATGRDAGRAELTGF